MIQKLLADEREKGGKGGSVTKDSFFTSLEVRDPLADTQRREDYKKVVSLRASGFMPPLILQHLEGTLKHGGGSCPSTSEVETGG